MDHAQGRMGLLLWPHIMRCPLGGRPSPAAAARGDTRPRLPHWNGERKSRTVYSSRFAKQCGRLRKRRRRTKNLRGTWPSPANTPNGARMRPCNFVNRSGANAAGNQTSPNRGKTTRGLGKRCLGPANFPRAGRPRPRQGKIAKVGGRGLEPLRIAPPDPKSGASAISPPAREERGEGRRRRGRGQGFSSGDRGGAGGARAFYFGIVSTMNCTCMGTALPRKSIICW